ncbi:hypothetical protein HWI79_522 [Cryptosporidium felis]|nr:hypothetical protein HWI79_522 [Cryptosporidium felis]
MQGSVNILFGNIGPGDSNLDNLEEIIPKSDFIFISYNHNEIDLNSILFAEKRKIHKFEVLHDSKSLILVPLVEKLMNILNFSVKKTLFWYSYSRNNVTLESSSKVEFEISDDYNLQKQRICLWEFDVRNCFSRLTRLILCNVLFTNFNSLNRQITCIKTLKYSIKEIVWKNFVCESIFNPDLSIVRVTENLVVVDFCDKISFVIFGKFSNSDSSEDFVTLLGQGELVSLNYFNSQLKQPHFTTYILKSITFSHSDIIYFNSVFPASKVIGSDFQDYCIHKSILDPCFDMFNFNIGSLSNFHNIHPVSEPSPYFLKFLFCYNARITQVSTGPESHTSMQMATLN